MTALQTSVLYINRNEMVATSKLYIHSAVTVYVVRHNNNKGLVPETRRLFILEAKRFYLFGNLEKHFFFLLFFLNEKK